MKETRLDEKMPDGNENHDMYLTFDVAGEIYAVKIQSVTTIVGVQHISEIPDLPVYVKGVMNLRGKVIPVMDVRLRFGLPRQAYDDRTTIIVLDLQGASTGLVVDKVYDVITLLPDEISPPLHWQASGEKGVICGLGKMENQVCIILDIERLLMDIDIHTDPAQYSNDDRVIVNV
jgi:purine-binding chemotaxis protein CheW